MYTIKNAENQQGDLPLFRTLFRTSPPFAASPAPMRWFGALRH
jgi:hypothetical protein